MNWEAEFSALRDIISSCGLEETVKWGQPCFTLDGRNVVLIHGFKEYCALLFFKGAIMQDPKNILIQQTENVQAARQIRFTGIADIQRLEKTLKSYVKDAIAPTCCTSPPPSKRRRANQALKNACSASSKAKASTTSSGSAGARQQDFVVYFSVPKLIRFRLDAPLLVTRTRASCTATHSFGSNAAGTASVDFPICSTEVITS